MYAIISFCGKQYKIYENQVFKIDYIDFQVGSEFEIDKVLVLFKNDELFLGYPYVGDCKIKLHVISHDKEKKINIIKFKRRKHHMKRMGHRQNYTIVKVLSIL